jgi:hypothetical protein
MICTMPTHGPRLTEAIALAQLSGLTVSISPCEAPAFSTTTEARVTSRNFSAPELVSNDLLRRQPDDGDAMLAGIVAKLAERCRRF